MDLEEILNLVGETRSFLLSKGISHENVMFCALILCRKEYDLKNKKSDWNDFCQALKEVKCLDSHLSLCNHEQR